MADRFKTDESQQREKMEQMDLDDILGKAENHETEATAESVGASLGGEGFLAQFAAVQDVKNDLSWDDIIPETEREKAQAEEREREAARKAAEEAEFANRRRTAAVAPGAYEGMEKDLDETSEPAAPPKKGKKESGKKKEGGTAPRKKPFDENAALRRECITSVL